MNKLEKIVSSVCTFGICVSLYTLYIEYQKHLDNNYVALCDISEFVACSKVFSSKYGKGFGLLELVVGQESSLNQPNPVFGIAYYLTILFLCNARTQLAINLQILLTFISLLGCVWLGYVLAFILEDFCIVCVSMYVTQSVLFILLCLRLRDVRGKVKQK